MAHELTTKEAPLIWDYEKHVEIEFKDWPNVADVQTLDKVIAVNLQKGIPVVIIPPGREKK